MINSVRQKFLIIFDFRVDYAEMAECIELRGF